MCSPSGYIVGSASIGTSNAQAGWTMNLSLSIANYNVQQLGSQIQAWAFAQASDGGEQYSSVQNYTVSS